MFSQLGNFLVILLGIFVNFEEQIKQAQNLSSTSVLGNYLPYFSYPFSNG